MANTSIARPAILHSGPTAGTPPRPGPETAPPEPGPRDRALIGSPPAGAAYAGSHRPAPAAGPGAEPGCPSALEARGSAAGPRRRPATGPGWPASRNPGAAG